MVEHLLSARKTMFGGGGSAVSNRVKSQQCPAEWARTLDYAANAVVRIIDESSPCRGFIPIYYAQYNVILKMTSLQQLNISLHYFHMIII